MERTERPTVQTNQFSIQTERTGKIIKDYSEILDFYSRKQLLNLHVKEARAFCPALNIICGGGSVSCSQMSKQESSDLVIQNLAPKNASMQQRRKYGFRCDFGSSSESTEIWHTDSSYAKNVPVGFSSRKKGLTHIHESPPPPSLSCGRGGGGDFSPCL